MLHAIIIIAINTGMRYDEATKVKIDLVKCTKYGSELRIMNRAKNFTKRFSVRAPELTKPEILKLYTHRSHVLFNLFVYKKLIF